MLREITSIDIKPAFLQRNKNDQEIFVETPKEAGENGISFGNLIRLFMF